MLIEFYEEENGTKPVLDYLMKCEKKVRAKLMRTIRLLELGGTSLRMPYSEYLREDILELRTQVGNNRYRVLYFFCDGEKEI